MRRVITSVDPSGLSVFSMIDEPEPTLSFGPGFKMYDLWQLDFPLSTFQGGRIPEWYSFVPINGAIFRRVVIPPDAVVQESFERGDAWGLESPFRKAGDDYGQHETPTQDFVTVVSGRVVLRLGSGQEVELTAGDVAVQRGTMHAWRNPGPDSVVLLVVMLGITPAEGNTLSSDF